jgi:cell division protease FtsH
MVTIYGLNEKVGNLTYYDSSGQSDYNFTKPYSDKTSELIDEEISKIIEEQYQRAISILKENKDKLVELAELLLEREVIFKDDLVNIFGERPFKKPEMIDNSNKQKKRSEEKEAKERSTATSDSDETEVNDNSNDNENDEDNNSKKDEKVESN